MKKSYSELGITSFVLFIISVILFLFGFDWNILVLELDHIPEVHELISIGIQIILLITTMILSILGFCIGIASFFIKDRRHIFAIIGSLGNFLLFVGIILLVIYIVNQFLRII